MVEQTALARLLKQRDDLYYGKALELKEAVAKWLSYIPATFPHYTQHTVEHSEAIIEQLSLILFEDTVSLKMRTSLSDVEIYVLIASAYLHDAGMVASDKEKALILSSEKWRQWISSGGGAGRWKEIEALRALAGKTDPEKVFAADIQTRFLLAEFIRREHHQRSEKPRKRGRESFRQLARAGHFLLHTSNFCNKWVRIDSSQRMRYKMSMFSKRSTKTSSLRGRYVTDRKGQRTGIVLSLKRYSRLMEDLHDLAVVAERRNEKPVTAEDMKKRLHKRGLL